MAFPFQVLYGALGFCLSSLREGFKSPTTALFVLDIGKPYLRALPQDLCLLFDDFNSG